MNTLLELIKIGVPAIVALVTSGLTIWKFIENNKLSREQKIEGIATQAVNIAEQLGNLGKLVSGTKLGYVMNYIQSKIELTATEIEQVKNFIEQTYVGFFAKPVTAAQIVVPVATQVESEETPAVLPTNEPLNETPSAEQVGVLTQSVEVQTVSPAAENMAEIQATTQGGQTGELTQNIG